jgi:hypothetical protein
MRQRLGFKPFERRVRFGVHDVDRYLCALEYLRVITATGAVHGFGEHLENAVLEQVGSR